MGNMSVILNKWCIKKKRGAEGNYQNICCIHLLQIVTLFQNVNSVISQKATLQDCSIFCSMFFNNFKNAYSAITGSIPKLFSWPNQDLYHL